MIELILLILIAGLLIWNLISKELHLENIWKENDVLSWMRMASTFALFVWIKTSLQYAATPELYKSEFYLILSAAAFVPKLLQKVVENYLTK